MSNTSIILAVGLGLGAGYLLLSDNRQQQPPTNNFPYSNYPGIPAQPRANTPEWAIWANAIIGAFGNVAALWSPGGPFYNNQNVLNQGFDINVDPNLFAGFV